MNSVTPSGPIPDKDPLLPIENFVLPDTIVLPDTAAVIGSVETLGVEAVSAQAPKISKVAVARKNGILISVVSKKIVEMHLHCKEKWKFFKRTRFYTVSGALGKRECGGGKKYTLWQFEGFREITLMHWISPARMFKTVFRPVHKGPLR